ncbi:MAG: ATP-binding protein [Candidatus Peribacteraceae bacterium]|nr:ATP-binding protein [Candidatus Peribacteraceae bacterium]
MPSRKKTPRPKVYVHKGLFGYPSTTRKLKPRNGREARVHRRRADTDMEAQLRLLAEALPQIVWTADPDGFQDYFNGRWFSFTGFSERETYGGKSALHPDDFSVYVERWSRALRSGKAYEAEYRFRRADGMYRWHLVRGLPVREGKRIVKWIGTFTDIQDQKQAAERLHALNEELERLVLDRTREIEVLRARDRANLQRLTDVMEHLHAGVVASDEHFRIIHCNKEYADMFRLGDPQSVVGMSGWELRKRVAESFFFPDAVMQRMNAVSEDRKPSFGFAIPLKDGRIVGRDFIPVFDHGVFRGHVVVYRDITREKKIDAAKSDFMSFASHQLRTPLTAVRWALSRLKKSFPPEQESAASLLNAAHLAAKNMAETINTMLSVSRIEAGTVSLALSDIRLHALLLEVRDSFRADIRQRKQRVIVRCPVSLRLRSDAKLLKEILSNILSNALKYSPERSAIDLIVTTGRDRVRLEVRDRGFGIPAHEREKIFGKFYRGENAVQALSEGSGLGLYLVSLLLRKLRGDIAVASEEGKGTVFTLSFPRVLREDPEAGADAFFSS